MDSRESCTHRTPAPPRGRPDLTWRHATESDLNRLSYTITATRWPGFAGLSPRAARVLWIYVALYRIGRIGYQGTRASHGAIAAAVRRCTGQAGSLSTVERGLRELVAAGWLSKAASFGRSGRQITTGASAGRWMRDPLCVYTLTEAARLELSGNVSHPPSTCPSVVLRKEVSLKPTSARARAVATDADADEPSKAESPQGVDGSELRGLAAAVEAPRPSPRPVAQARGARHAGQDGEPQRPCQARKRGKPRTLHRDTKPATRREAIALILATLEAETNRGARGGRLARARAALELAGGALPGEASGIGWDYWIARWPELTRDERRSRARAELIPLLVDAARRADRGSPPGPQSGPIADLIARVLKTDAPQAPPAPANDRGHTRTTPPPHVDQAPASAAEVIDFCRAAREAMRGPVRQK